jgi:polypeptide N-acetylgalactosaminyltransferase
MPGWLEPLVWRIHSNRKTVVIPSLRPIDTHGLSVSSTTMWPPPKGSFNWRMSFTHASVDYNTDIIPFGIGSGDQKTSRWWSLWWNSVQPAVLTYPTPIYRVSNLLSVSFCPTFVSYLGCVRTPVMPGGIFAMDRLWFNELGGCKQRVVLHNKKTRVLNITIV